MTTRPKTKDILVCVCRHNFIVCFLVMISLNACVILDFNKQQMYQSWLHKKNYQISDLKIFICHASSKDNKTQKQFEDQAPQKYLTSSRNSRMHVSLSSFNSLFALSMCECIRALREAFFRIDNSSLMLESPIFNEDCSRRRSAILKTKSNKKN